MRILVAIESCHRDRAYQHAQRNTWLADLVGAEYKFFLGNAGKLELPLDDEIFLDVDDSYAALSQKTQGMCRWALDNGFDSLFKCDIDTVINPRHLLMSFTGEDYLGGENSDVDIPGFYPGKIEFASGGAGYFLSNKALTIVTNAATIKTSAEDVFVAAELWEHGIKPVFHPGFCWRPGADVDKDVVTLHLSSALQKKYEPSQMYEYYKKIKEGAAYDKVRGEIIHD